jgi:hypothetical protein
LKAGSAARGIEAEILFCGYAAKKIAADSPVFLRFTAKKCARNKYFEKAGGG